MLKEGEVSSSEVIGQTGTDGKCPKNVCATPSVLKGKVFLNNLRLTWVFKVANDYIGLTSFQFYFIHLSFLDTLAINGVASKLPFNVKVTVESEGIWTYTLNSAFSVGAFPPMLFLMVAFLLLA